MGREIRNYLWTIGDSISPSSFMNGVQINAASTDSMASIVVIGGLCTCALTMGT